MRLDISELLKKKCTEINFDESYEITTLEREDYIVSMKAPLSIRGRAINEGDIVEVKGDFTATLKVQCTRCLEEFVYTLEAEFDENFSKSAEEVEENEYYLIVDGDLVFDELIMDYIILTMPVRLICNEECKGLCHQCGANLNKVDCDCDKETVNPKFAALKDLFKQDEEV